MATTVSSRRARDGGRRRGGSQGSPGADSRFARARRAAVVASVLVIAVAAVAFISSMTGRSNSAFNVRAVEWLRDNGAAGLVAQVEDLYYSLTAPTKGGPTLKALPKVGVATAPGQTAVTAPASTAPSAGRSARRVHHQHRTLAPVRPRRVASMLHPALPGEGVWEPTRGGLGSVPPLLVTTLRDEPDYPRVVVGLAWIDTRRTQLVLYPGMLEPALTLPTRGPMEVPPARRGRLLATFNSGFKLSDAGGDLGDGGYVLGGHTYAPMHDGLATLIGYRDGRINILDWTHGALAPHSILYARQNLPLIVDRGRPSPSISDGSLWGATVGNAVLVWRSGIGIDRHGNLIYAAGNDQTAQSLASALIRAGAVRAMELDINSYWVSFITYDGWGALGAANLLPDMNRTPLRYLSPDDRDFFAVYLRRRPLG